MNKYAKLIEKVDKSDLSVNIGFITDTKLQLWSIGYKIADHMEAEEMVIKSGLFKYDFSCLQEYDPMVGITYTNFIKR